MTNSNSEASSAAVIAATQYGKVEGRLAGDVVTYLGIPYAAPPVRFALPAPPEPWDGVRPAIEPGDCAPHLVKPFPKLDVLPLVGPGALGGRDYLRLNIWGPAKASAAPVMVFIHGGGFLVGSKDAPIQEGTAFARSGLLCVAINYRMGIDGFLPIPGVPTNLGLRDMLFALQWVQDNIAAFGGDPANVTVFGESAGAMAIADLVTSPLAEGLFRRAIIQSGHGSMVREIGIAQRLVNKLARVLRIAPTADGFRKVGDAAAIAAIEKVSKPTARLDLRDETGREPVFGISRFIPVAGDDVLPVKPLAALRRGRGAQVDVLIGSNAQEMNLYFVPTGVRAKINRWLARWLLGKSQPNPRQVLRDYGFGQPGVKPGEAMTNAMHDLVFRWPARQYAAAHRGRTWAYEFDWQSPACDGQLGACHGMELPFVFQTLAKATGEEGLAGTAPPQDLADRIHAIWVGFATDGTLPWPQFDEQSRLVYQLARGEAVHEPVMPAAAHLPD